MSARRTQTDLARRLLSLLDLTSLGANDTDASVTALAGLASTSAGRVAAVCIWPRFIGVVRQALKGTGVLIAAVANFPTGRPDIDAAATETAAAIAAGANEVDVVFPYRSLLSGDETTGLELVRACGAACGSGGLLKVILETGQLESSAHIRRAAEIAVEGGAHFLKTSTGKTQPAATLPAAAVLIEVIATARAAGRTVGLKPSGGLSRIEDAQAYLDLYEARFGKGSATPATFRLGASSLIHPLLAILEQKKT